MARQDNPAPGTSGQNVQKSGGKYRQDSSRPRPSERLRQDDGGRLPDEQAPPTGGAAPPGKGGGADPKGNASGGGAPKDKKQARSDRRYEKSGQRVEKSGEKLDEARDNLSKQKPPKKPGTIKSAGRAVGHEAHAYVHGKIYQVEQENVGVEAAHKAELAGEGALRGGTRFVKHRIRTRPARQVRKWEKKNGSARASHEMQRLAREHPEANKSALSRLWQKQKQKWKYQKQARETTRKTAQAAKKTAEATEKVARHAFLFVKRHPVVVLLLVGAFLLIITMQSCMSSLVSIGNGTIGAIGASTYPAEDADMLGAEAAYAAMEAGLQYELDNYETLHSGYDEYHYDLDDIEHDPYVLISILSAFSEGAWTLDEVQGTLSMLFERQYTLTESVVVERRSYEETDTWTDPETGETHSDTYTVYYDYYICTVTLDNFNLSHLPVYMMSEAQLGRYALYMKTLGNRPDLFPTGLYPNASTLKEPIYYDIPPEALEDEVFAAIITEAEKYLGYPYVWGGSSPTTSFDCSGFVSWVINHSGWSVGRLGAQGLYNICTPVTSANAKPGDLVFFIGTYDTPGVSHVGIYVGENMMIHCGDPISYASLNTSYWQSHLYAYGRLP